MKVLHICTKAMSGSVGKIARDIVRELPKYDCDAVVCYARSNDVEDVKAFRFSTKLDVYSHAVMARLFDSDGLHSKSSTIRLVRYIEKFSPDIIHLHCLHGYYINYKMLFKYLKNTNIHVIWTMHDCWAFTGHCTHFDFIKCYKWKGTCNHCPQKKEFPKSILFDRSKRNYLEKKKVFTSLGSTQMTLVSPSQWLLGKVEQSFLSKYSIRLINNSVNANIFYPDSTVKVKKRILGVANNWGKRKGLNDFIELSKILPNDYFVFIVGANEQQISNLGKNGIKSIKRTANQQELASLYRESAILFNPTYEDNYPTVNLEAIACGLPVVTYNTGGSPEAIKNTGFGLVIEKKDYDNLIAFLDIAYNREIYMDKSLNYNMVNSYIKLYKELIE